MCVRVTVRNRGLVFTLSLCHDKLVLNATKNQTAFRSHLGTSYRRKPVILAP